MTFVLFLRCYGVLTFKLHITNKHCTSAVKASLSLGIRKRRVLQRFEFAELVM